VEKGEFGSLSLLSQAGSMEGHLSPPTRADRVPRFRRQEGLHSQGAAPGSPL